MTARFDVSLLMEDFSENLLSDLVLGTRQAVAEMLQVSLADVQVKVVKDTETTRRLSVTVKLEVMVSSSSSDIAMLSSELGQEVLHNELLETWDERGLPLENFNVLLGSVEATQTEDTGTTTSQQSETFVEAAPSNASNLVMLVVVLCTFLCSAIAGVVYCWRWRGVAVVPQSPKLQVPQSPCPQPTSPSSALTSSKGGASPAAVSAMRSAARSRDEKLTPLPVPKAGQTGQTDIERHGDAENNVQELETKDRPSSVQVRVVQAGEKPSAHAVRVNATVSRSATVSSSRSPLSQAPRPSESEPRTRSEHHRLPLEPVRSVRGV